MDFAPCPEKKNGASQRLRHRKFSTYFQNSKLEGGNRTFLEIYISTRIYDLGKMRGQKGLDRNRPSSWDGWTLLSLETVF